MANNYNEEDGVWRTVGGRRIFIRTGQSLSDAMIQSGKFKNLRSDYRKAKAEENKSAKDLDDELRAKEDKYLSSDKGRSEQEKEQKEIKELHDKLKEKAKEEGYDTDKTNWRDDLKAKQEAVNKSFEENQRQLQEAMKNETYPRAEGGTKFEDLGLEVSDKKAFSDYLRDKYGTDDFRVINFDNKEGAKKIYDEYASQREKDRITNYFNEQERNAYLNKDWSYGYGKETLENMSNKELDEYIKKNEELVNEYTNRYNQSSQYDQRYTRNRQDKLFDSASKTKYEKQLQDAQNEKARREAEVDKYFTKVDSKENSKDTFTQQLDMHGGTIEYTKADLDRMKEAGVKPMEHSYTGGGWEGVNSDKYMDTKDQAKAITDAMKKQYPDVKISRRSDNFSGGSAIDFNIMSSDKDLFVSDADIDKMEFSDFGRLSATNDFEWWAKDNVPRYQTEHSYTVDDVRKYAKQRLAENKKRDIQSPKGDEWYLSDYGKKVVSELNKQANSYTYDDSDGMYDYFDHGTYMHINIGKWDKPYQVNQKSTSQTMNDKIRNSGYKKYMKEHPNSKMTLDEYLKKK